MPGGAGRQYLRYGRRASTFGGGSSGACELAGPDLAEMGGTCAGSADDCVIFLVGGGIIWSKFKVWCAAIAVFGELDHNGRPV
uniref:Uncharacterized protein n=1 Tax=Romanomermis culicivorax TaxID=13658 RepID=A0A915IHW6_ROMCU